MDLEYDPYLGLGLLALLVALYGLLAAQLGRWSVSAPFAFLVIGTLIGGAGLGMAVDGLPKLDTLSILAEVTLALVLFAAASTIRLKRLEVDTGIVVRLLGIGLPLTIVLGTVVAMGLFPGISMGLAVLIAATLAPTDADLGQQVIADTSVPARVRRVLNVESGLNDGIVAPVITVAIVLAIFGDVDGIQPLVDALRELAVAVIAGVVIGGSGSWLLFRSPLRTMASHSSRQLATLALALGAYFIAAGLDGSGFIAAFAAGLAFGATDKKRVGSAVGFTEVQGTLLTILVWLVFGLVIVDEQLIGMFDPLVLLYALLALTLMRLVPVALSLVGTGFDRASVLFIGWFGPRGLASIVFVLLAVDSLDAAGVDTGPLGPIVAWTVVLSVILHGFSATPLARRYGRYAGGLSADAPERVGEMEPRRATWRFHEHHRTPG